MSEEVSPFKRLLLAGPAIGAILGAGIPAVRGARFAPKNLMRTASNAATGAGIGWLPDVLHTGAQQLSPAPTKKRLSTKQRYAALQAYADRNN